MAANPQHPTLSFPKGLSIYAVTDVHSSFDLNMKWVEGISLGVFPSSILLVAGDVAETLPTIKKTLLLFKEAFTEVFYVPGNHDLWLSQEEREGGKTSFQKIHELLDLCKSIGVHTLPTKVAYNEKDTLWVAPILAWHHSSFDHEPDIPKEVAAIPPHNLVFQDFHRCSWSPMDPLTPQVAESVDQLNDQLSPENLFDIMHQTGDLVLSFSHFLPHLELLPEKRFLYYPNLAKAVGSLSLQKRVRKLKPKVHVFGHTHFGWDMEIEGTRFIQTPLAYPSERERRMKSLYVGEGGEEEHGSTFPQPLFPLKIFDSEGNKFETHFWAHWSHSYTTRERDPENTELAPWVKDRWK
jgi:Icc-related predicted phosphoesterase